MSHSRNHPTGERKLEEAIYAALVAQGRLLPVTPEQVARAEKRLWELVPEARNAVPPAFSEVAISDRMPSSAPLLNPRDCQEVETALARAARRAGDMSPEIEAAMRRDRDRTEAEENNHA